MKRILALCLSLTVLLATLPVTILSAEDTTPVTATAAEVIYGDVNDDEKVNNRDLGLLQQHLNDWDVELNMATADVNYDGKVNNRDLGLLQQYLNDWDVDLGPGDTLNGVNLADYTIVYSEEALAYTDRAADYIREEIYARTGVYLNIVTDDTAPAKHEIVVGETNRSISKTLNATTEGFEFSMLAKDGHVAMEGDYFIIAAAAYYFIHTYIVGDPVATTVPTTAQVLTPIVEEANNYILLIGDGMGINQTKLPEVYDLDRFEDPDLDVNNFTDNENLFYGYLFPYSGYARTHNVYGQVTDSAASGTALATGYKTSNGRIGKDKDKNDLKSLTELAGERGMATAVMSTEGQTGATPGGFSAHQDARDMYDEIKADQEAMTEKYGTIVKCKFDYYQRLGINYYLRPAITKTLEELNQNENGFFMMYEEAYIDKHSHNQDKEKATWAVYRFNQAIAMFMEFAFYNPDTAVIITADHETGGLTDLAGIYKYSHGDHTAQLVPVFAYGVGTEVFHDKTIENVQIPKTIAKMWGESLAADTDEQYPPLN